MTSGSGTDSQGERQALSIVILGADAVLAAVPATPVQLAHACLQAGYDAAVPASWGDELIAAAVLGALRERNGTPAVQCSCPLVARRLLSLGTELQPFLISVVSPPVAAARYLRAMHGGARLRIAYVGRCPGAVDDDIDARITPEELLAVFADRQIALLEQPDAFEEVIPPDRRRFRSLPGGVPRPDALRAASGRALVELDGDALSIELTQLLLTGGDVLADLAPALGCVCSGARPATATLADEAHARVAAHEPPLATGPVIDESVPVPLSVPIKAPSRVRPEVATAVPVTPAADLWLPDEDAPQALPAVGDVLAEADAPAVALPPDAVTPAAPPPARRRSPGQGLRALVGMTPIARDADGRQLPRTYVARRRSSPRGLRAITIDLVSSSPTPVPGFDAAPNGTTHAGAASEHAVEAPAAVTAASVQTEVEAAAPTPPQPVPEESSGADTASAADVASAEPSSPEPSSSEASNPEPSSSEASNPEPSSPEPSTPEPPNAEPASRPAEPPFTAHDRRRDERTGGPPPAAPARAAAAEEDEADAQYVAIGVGLALLSVVSGTLGAILSRLFR